MGSANRSCRNINQAEFVALDFWNPPCIFHCFPSVEIASLMPFSAGYAASRMPPLWLGLPSARQASRCASAAERGPLS